MRAAVAAKENGSRGCTDNYVKFFRFTVLTKRRCFGIIAIV